MNVQNDRSFATQYPQSFSEIRTSRHSESRVVKAITGFFVACSAVSGIAFLVTASPIALTALFVFGALSIALAFPSSHSSNNYRVNSTARGYVQPPYIPPTTTYVYESTSQAPATVYVQQQARQPLRQPLRQSGATQPTVFVQTQPVVPTPSVFDRHPIGSHIGSHGQERYENPRVVVLPDHGQLPTDAFIPSQPPVPTVFERHPLREPRTNQEPRNPLPTFVQPRQEPTVVVVDNPQERHAVGSRGAPVPEDQFERHQIGKK